MKGFESALECLGDIVCQPKIQSEFKAAIIEIRDFFPDCDIYVADGINKPRGRVSVGTRDLEEKRANHCVFRFRETKDDKKIYLNFNLDKKSSKELIEKFNNALITIGGIEAFKRVESGKTRYGISIDKPRQLKRILELIALSDLSKKMNGNSWNPDDYWSISDTESTEKPIPLKTTTTRSSIGELAVFLEETRNLQPKFVKWLNNKYDIKNPKQQDKNSDGKKPDVVFLKNGREIICELKCIESADTHLKIRSAIGQLLEYRFFSKVNNEKIDLWLVLNNKPSDDYIYYLKSLKSVIGKIFSCYVQDNNSFRKIL